MPGKVEIMEKMTQLVNTETLNDFFGTDIEGGQFGIEFKELTWECDDLEDFIEDADEGTCYKDKNGELYFKIRNNYGDCEVFYFLNDSIRQI
jgi:hypothetical protein